MTDAGPSPGRRLLSEVARARRRAVAAASTLFVSHQVGELMVPVVAGVIIDRAVATGDSAALVRWGALLVLAFACLSTSWRWADRILTRACEGAGHDLRLQITRRVTRHDGLADAAPVGQTVSIASSDVDAVVEIQTAIAATAAATAAIVTAATVLVWISLPLGLVVLLGLPPVLGALHVLAAPIEARVAAQQADVGRAAATATDLLHGLRVLKGLHAEDEATRRYQLASRRSLTAGLRAARLYAAHGGLTGGVTGLFVAVVALVGGRFAAEDRISVGELVAAVGVTQFLVGPLGRIGYAAALRSAARASADRVASVLEAAPAVVDGASPVTDPAGTLAFRSVRHGPLDELDLDISARAFTAVATSDPRDAEAIVALLSRRADPDRGSVELDGVPLSRLALGELRRAVVVAEHEAALFGGTVRDNVLVRSPQFDRLDEVMHAAAADELAGTLSSGLDTVVTERGMSLSGGQRQRVALARTLALDPPVLVLHEPTTAIDAVTEGQIATGLRAHRAGSTTLVMTTSPAMLAAADQVVFVDGGRVAEVATHAELLARNASYAEAVAT